MTNIRLSQVLQQVQADVAEKRRAGTYPPGLEEELEIEFAEIIARAAAQSEWHPAELKNLLMNYLAVIDHLAMTIVDLESRVSRLETDRSGR